MKLHFCHHFWGEAVMKYRSFLLATASGVALAPAANAADLPTKAPAYVPPPPPVSWTGFYAGVNLGANWQGVDSTYGALNGEAAGTGISGGNKVGFIGGAQIGYNWQFDPRWVLGIEGSIQGLTGTASGGTPAGGSNASKGNGVESQIKWVATLRGRVGWLMHPDTMIYGTGGAAWARIKQSANPLGLTTFGGEDPFFTTKSSSKTKFGWVAGGGMEHMLTRNWTVGVEVLYHNFGTTTGFNGDSSKSSDFKNKLVTGTVKLNYKF
jgi:outer membrane immunogenic protein